ncbi:amidase [Sinomonas halotolerans]|uniref:Amidase n=1 Tax=Sinomonas halotolerans TaxID=1644133 RepID=A0ABU9WYS4_9MICC
MTESPGPWPSAVGLRDALRAGEVSAREAAGHFLARIEAENPQLGAFLAVTAERALEDAAAADSLHARLARSGRLEDLPLLHGMPTAYKDLTDVAGVPTTHGSAALEPRPAPADSPLVELLRKAGTVCLGKTQVPEFGLTAYSENRIAPPSRNPHATALSSGGSSGGSAAAVAAGLVPFAPGTDGGGSVRIPAAACGIVGLKPGRGLVPAGEGSADDGGPRLVVAGPLAHTAEDAALLLDAMTGGAPPPGGARARPGAGTGLAGREAGGYLDAVVRGPGRLRIAVSLTSPWDAQYTIAPEPEAFEALRRAVARLEDAGHLVAEADLRFDNRYPDAFTAAWTAGVGAARIPPAREALLTPLTRAFRRRAQQRSPGRLAEAHAFLRRFERDMLAQLSGWDAVLSPALAQSPRPVGWFSGGGAGGRERGDSSAGGAAWTATADDDYRLQCEFAPWSSWVNVCGLPAVAATTLWTPGPEGEVLGAGGAGAPRGSSGALPAGGAPRGSSGALPAGVQLVGPPGSEAMLLQLALLLHEPRRPSAAAG